MRVLNIAGSVLAMKLLERPGRCGLLRNRGDAYQLFGTLRLRQQILEKLGRNTTHLWSTTLPQRILRLRSYLLSRLLSFPLFSAIQLPIVELASTNPSKEFDSFSANPMFCG